MTNMTISVKESDERACERRPDPIETFVQPTMQTERIVDGAAPVSNV